MSQERDERRAYRVIGRVQGVGFRWWTRRVAEELGLGGHVRNRPDGSVEVHATGPVAALDRLETVLRDGPPGAWVEDVQAVEADARMRRDEFRIELW